MSKKTAYFGVFIALAFIFSYIETLIPINIGIPGVKLGLANLVVIIAFYIIGAKEALALSVIRIILVGFTFGNLASMVYSMAGGVLSFAAMFLAKKINLFSMTGVSVVGGVFHNVGQIVVAIIVVSTSSLIYYLPVLIISGTVTGVLIGLLGSIILKRLNKIDDIRNNF